MRSRRSDTVTRTTTGPRFGAAVRVIAVAQVAASTAAGLVLTTASVAAVELAGTEQVAGTTQTAMVIGASVLTVPIARRSSRSGRRAALTLAYGIASAGALIAAAAVGLGLWWLLVLGSALIGGGTVAGLAARFAAADSAPSADRTASVIAFVLWASTVGSLVGPNLASLTGSTGAATFLLPAALYAAAAACIRGGMPPTPATFEPARRRGTRPKAITVLRAHPRALAGVVISTASHGAMIALMALAPVHLHAAGQHTSAVGLVMSAHLAAMYGFSPVFGALVRHCGALRCGVAALALAASASGVLAVGAQGGVVLFGVGLALLGAAWSLGMIAGSTLVTLGLPTDQRAAAQGLTDLLLNVGGGVASMTAGLVAAAVGYPTLGVGTAALVTCCLVALLPIGRRRLGPTEHTGAPR
ncbi:MFS transporter [Rathayibacter rathayi]|uniref:MFS transporter n=1 Tax=Rathayibacter rathayi TaxID=33887 RepID=A0ABX5AC42_RATRA|nr:MFS transporter [Rathayibacter rathayi]